MTHSSSVYVSTRTDLTLSSSCAFQKLTSILNRNNIIFFLVWQHGNQHQLVSPLWYIISQLVYVRSANVIWLTFKHSQKKNAMTCPHMALTWDNWQLNQTKWSVSSSSSSSFRPSPSFNECNEFHCRGGGDGDGDGCNSSSSHNSNISNKQSHCRQLSVSHERATFGRSCDAFTLVDVENTTLVRLHGTFSPFAFNCCFSLSLSHTLAHTWPASQCPSLISLPWSFVQCATNRIIHCRTERRQHRLAHTFTQYRRSRIRWFQMEHQHALISFYIVHVCQS